VGGVNLIVLRQGGCVGTDATHSLEGGKNKQKTST